MSRTAPDAVISDDARFLLPYVAVTRLRRDAVVTAPWLHGFQGNRVERLVCARSSCVLATNQALLRDVHAAGAAKRTMFVTGNPVPQELVDFGAALQDRCETAAGPRCRTPDGRLHGQALR